MHRPPPRLCTRCALPIPATCSGYCYSTTRAHDFRQYKSSVLATRLVEVDFHKLNQYLSRMLQGQANERAKHGITSLGGFCSENVGAISRFSQSLRYVLARLGMDQHGSQRTGRLAADSSQDFFQPSSPAFNPSLTCNVSVCEGKRCS